MRDYRKEKSVRGAWAARERLLVAVGPDAQAERLVRAGKRLADRLDAEWLVVYVETPDLLRLSEAERNRRIAILRLADLARRRGHHARRLLGRRRAARVRAHPQRHAHPGRAARNRPRWRRLLRPSTTDQLLGSAAATSTCW